MQEMRQLLQDASEQEQRVQAELAERDAKVATAAARIEELETAVNTKPKSKGELEEWADELERESFQIAQERRTVDEDRKQLREDEATLEKQMRDMEVQMARERALLARQEQELKRLNAEIQHELELMQRGDAQLRGQLENLRDKFQKEHQKVMGSRGGGPPAPQSPAPPPPPQQQPKDSGLLKRFFGRGG